MNELICIEDVQKMAVAACKSGLFGLPSAEAAMTLMLLCQSEGLHPIQAVKRYHIIQGRCSMRADAMLAEFQRLGGKVEWLKRTDTEVVALFSHELGKAEITWTIEMARNAGLAGKDIWKKYPRQLLTARCISEGIRTVLPGCIVGIYTPEEVQDFDTEPAKTTRKAKTQETPASDAQNVPVDTKPTEPEKAQPAPAKIAEPTLADKTIGTAKPADEFTPKDAEIVEPTPEVKAADRPAKSASQMANELMKLRELAIKAGCKNSVEIKELYEAIADRPLEAATSLSDAEREAVKARLQTMIAEKEAVANG